MNGNPWPPRSAEEYRREAVDRLGPDLAAAFGGVELLVLDADGVLTGGHLIYGPTGEAFKEFHAQDGLGLVMAQVTGLKLAVLTGRQSEIVACRARELRFHAIKLGRFDKLAALREILAEVRCGAAATLYMGDDLVDLLALYAVGLPVTVPSAPADVRRHCRYVTRAAGGSGAVREVVDLVLKGRGLYSIALQKLAEKAWPVPPGGQE